MTPEFTPPTYTTGQHIIGQDGTHGHVQYVQCLFGEPQYVLDHDTVLAEREVIGLHQDKKITQTPSAPS